MKNYIHRMEVYKVVAIFIWISLQFNFTSYSQDIYSIPVEDSVKFKCVEYPDHYFDSIPNNIYLDRYYSEFISFSSIINSKLNGLLYEYHENAGGKYDLTQIVYYKDDNMDKFALFFHEGKLCAISLDIKPNTTFVDDTVKAGDDLIFQAFVFRDSRLSGSGYGLTDITMPFSAGSSICVGEWIIYNEDGSVKEKKYYNLHDCFFF